MIITIENYRGFEIEFSTESGQFHCIATENNFKESKSYNAVKKFVDEYIKENQTFKPFHVERIPTRNYTKGTIKIVGIRKDGRYITEDKNGLKGQLSDYSLGDYMLIKESNANKIELIKTLDVDYNKTFEDYRESRNAIVDTLDIVTLKEYKKINE